MIKKIQKRLWQEFVRRTNKKSVYPFFYKSYWHRLFAKGLNGQNNVSYLSAVPNRGAGIGHQLANWIAGYWFAKQFGVNFAHISFSNEKWERFFGFGEDEITVDSLVRDKQYQKIRLPLFDEKEPKSVEIVRQIIKSYAGKKVVFVLEQDQFYEDQHGVMDDLKRKFYAAKSRATDQLIFDKNELNIAVHVRRGDIVIGQQNQNPNLLMRWQSDQYFETVVENVLALLNTDRKVNIFLFSQGKESDFESFSKFPNVTYCLDMNAEQSFLHMVYADILITSKSSFSYKPALLNNGVKIVPDNFWHGYPTNEKWVIADADGNFTTSVLQEL